MAAEAAISSVVQLLAKLLIQKVEFLLGVKEDIQWLKTELEWMQGFLKDAAQKQATDEMIRLWISEIRELAYDAEDTINIFILKVENATRSRRLLKSWKSIPDLNTVGEQIVSIRKRLHDIDRRRKMYRIQYLGEGVKFPMRSSEEVEWRRLAPWENDKDVVGLEDDVKMLLEKAILDGRKGLSIAAIVGKGGIGKSTLARKIYNDAAVAARFDCRAWVVVSSEFTLEETMKQVMLELHKSREDKQKVVKDVKELEESTKDKRFLQQKLKEMLHKHLAGKRYFIVLDDVLEQTHWDALTSAFPHEQDKAGRLLITSRSRVNRDGLSFAPYVHEMKMLDRNKSWELFLKKAFTDGTCQKELEHTGRRILEKCGGLPLAITVIGGFLVNQRQFKREWEKVLNGMDSHLERSEDDVSGILELSYHYLPPQVRSCFLCLSFFKENATIPAKTLVRIWIAEGLVIEGEGKRTREDIGMAYLDELIKRNLVQVKEMTIDHQIKTCYMHGLLHELSIKKAKEEIGFKILSEEENSQSSHKPRHLAVYYNRERFISSKNQNKHLRSVLFYGNGERLQFTDLGSTSYWKSFEVLRVLNFEGFQLMGNLTNKAIGALIGLRYLGLRDTGIKQLPSSLGRLKRLEVLDIAQNDIEELPKVIWELEALLHLYADTICSAPPPEVGIFKNIKTLKYISDARELLNHISQLTGLRKLGLVGCPGSDFSDVYSSLAALKHFVSLSIIAKIMSPERGEIPAILRGFRVLERLTKLKLKNFSTSGLPSAFHFPPNLSNLSLIDGYLYEDSIQVLKKLRKLSYLRLHGEYWGDKMLILNGEFPKLKVLFLQKMTGLRHIPVEKGAMPELKRLEIYECEDLFVRISQSDRQELKILTDEGVDVCHCD